MDPQRFDSLARSLATPKSRRGFLGSVAALLAGLTGRRAADAQVTQAKCGNKVCAANPAVCTNGCVCCVWGNGNSRCMPPGNCTGTVATTTTTAPPCPSCPVGQICQGGGCCSPNLGPCTVSDDCCGDGFCSGTQCIIILPTPIPTFI